MRAVFRFLLLAVIALVLLVVISFFLIQTPSVVNLIAQALEHRTGYRIHVEDISLSPSLRGTVRGLEVRENGLLMSARSVSVKGSISPSLRTEIEEMVLEEPRFRIELGKEKREGDLGFIEKIPPVGLLRIRNGEVDISMPGQVIKLTGLDLTLRGFSPKGGGAFTAEGGFSISSKAEGGPQGTGRYSGSVNLTGLLPMPRGVGSMEVSMDSASYGTLKLGALEVKSSFRMEGERITITQASFLCHGLAYRETALKGMEGEATGSYDLKSRDFSVGLLKGQAEGLGEFKGSLKGKLTGEYPWETSISASAVDLASVFSLSRPYLPPEYGDWLLEGAGDLEVELRGSYKPLSWAGQAVLEVRKGGFSSPDGSRAGQGLTGRMVLKLQSHKEGNKADFGASSELDGGELLIGKYYRAFSEGDVKIRAEGSFSLDTLRPVAFTGRLGAFGAVDCRFSGTLERDRWGLHVEAQGVSLGTLLGELVSSYFGRDSPIGALRAEGHGSISLDLLKQGEGMAFEGSLGISSASLALPEGALSVRNLNVSLPFDLAYPPAASPGGMDEGRKAGLIDVKHIGIKGMEFKDLSIPIILSGNAVSIPSGLEVNLAGGKLALKGFHGEGLLSPSMALGFGLSLKGADLGELTESLSGTRISGSLDVDLPSVLYREGRWTAEGGIKAGVFDGAVEVSGLFAENVLSASRAFGADISFGGINLGRATEKLRLGKVEGVIRGSLRDFAMSYGQPASFLLDVESVRTKGVKQRISVDAIENLSILGTGSSGVSRALNSGINRFFKEYGYSAMGFTCTLKNDVFTLRGKIHRGGKEYLIWRGLLWGVNVINQNPDNMIRFADMQKRIKRIFAARGGEVIVK
jgi:hypothetical protein